MITRAALAISLFPHRPRLREGLLERLVLDVLVVVKESGFDLLFRDLTELTSVAGSCGFELGR